MTSYATYTIHYGSNTVHIADVPEDVGDDVLMGNEAAQIAWLEAQTDWPHPPLEFCVFMTGDHIKRSVMYQRSPLNDTQMEWKRVSDNTLSVLKVADIPARDAIDAGLLADQAVVHVENRGDRYWAEYRFDRAAGAAGDDAWFEVNNGYVQNLELIRDKDNLAFQPLYLDDEIALHAQDKGRFANGALPEKGPNNGWSYRNTGEIGNKIFWTIYESQSAEAAPLLAHIRSVFARLMLNSAAAPPSMVIYTYPQGDGQDAGGEAYRSRLDVDVFPDTIPTGEALMFRINDPDIARYNSLSKVSLGENYDGPGDFDERVKSITITSDETAGAGAVDIEIFEVGYAFSAAAGGDGSCF